MADGLLNEKAEAALAKLEESTAYHDEKLRRILEQQEAYEGLLSPLSEAAQWESHLHPPLLQHVIETALTMLVDDSAVAEINPQPGDYDDHEWAEAQEGAKAHEAVYDRQLAADRYEEFRRPFVLNAALNRVAIAKTIWCEERETRKGLKQKRLLPAFGKYSPVRMRETSKERVIFDGPKTQVVDLRDFYWNEAAVSLDDARWVAHAIWMSPSDLQRMADSGKYDAKAVNLICEPYPEGKPGEPPQGNEIELKREKRGRRNGQIEVLEIWDRDTKLLHVLGARRALLLQQDWPFWHGEFPFVAMSLAPFPFSIQGLSLVEKLAPMQEAFWNILNQTIDNLKLINNAIVLMASDYDDPDSFEYAPGAVNTVDNPSQVTMWTPNVNIAQVAMPMLEKIQADMQNLAMGQPISIPMSGRVTATEIATLSQIAQTAAAKMKDQITYAERRIGNQRMELNRQFIRSTQYFTEPGLDNVAVRKAFAAHLFSYEFEFSLKPSTESAVRAEKRSEWMTLAQAVTQAAPVAAQAGAPFNLRAIWDKVFQDGYEQENTDQFWASKQPMLAAGVPTGPPGGGQPDGQGPGGQPLGVTGPNSINPAVSPSAQASVAPGVMLARALASQGGAMNGGAH